MLLALLLLAQADPTSGASGWAGAGLLGGVLAWLMFVHLPAKDKQLTAFLELHAGAIAKKDATIEDQRREFATRLEGQRGEFVTTVNALVLEFRAENRAERAACETHFKTLSDTMSAALTTIGNQLSEHSKRNQQHNEVLREALKQRVDELSRQPPRPPLPPLPPGFVGPSPEPEPPR